MFLHLRQWIQKQRRLVKDQKSRNRYVRLTLEDLEPRIALDSTSFTWTGADRNVSTKWSDRLNWVWPDGTFPTRPPGTGDDVKFDTVQNPLNANSTDDVAQVTNLIMTANYTGTITIVGTLTITGPNSSMAAGTLGTGNLVINATANASFTWTGGTLATLLTTNNATMTISGANDKTLNTALTDKATATWQDGGNILFTHGSVIYVASSGTFTSKAPATMKTADSSTGVFSVAGTFDVTPGSGNTTTMKVKFTTDSGSNTNVQTGELLTNSGSDLSGTLTISGGGAFVNFGSADPYIDKFDGCTVTGTGTAYFTGHLSVVSDSSVAAPVIDAANTVDGSAILSISNSYDWLGLGAWAGSGKMKIVAGGGQLSLHNSGGTGAYSLGRTIDNFGVVTWSSTGRDISVTNSANIINENGATFHIQTDKNILNGGGAGTFQNNSGAVLVKDGGSATTRIDIPFSTNAGQINVTAPGARIEWTTLIKNAGAVAVNANNAGMDFVAGFEQDSGSTIASAANTATITVAGGNFVLKGGTVSASGAACGISVTGQYQQSGGTSTPGAYSTFSATDTIVETGGTIELQGGTLSATNGVQVQPGGILQGYGFVTTSTLTNSGTINPGDIGNIGTISITGNYTQTSGGVLNEDITYSPPPGGATSDLLAVSGLATLSGTLNISLISGAPYPGPTMELFTYGTRSGSWTSINPPPPPGQGHWAYGFADGGNPGYFYLSDVVP